MTDFRQQAELGRLARLLHVPETGLEFLHTADVDSLRQLRTAASRLLLDSRRTLFGRIAAASKLLPTALVARIAEHSMGPLLCARVAGEMATARAIDIARHLKPEFLARAAVHLETQRACELTAALPIERVAAVAQELIRRREYIVLGELVDTLPLSIVQAILPAIDDGEALLRSAFFLEHTGRIADMLAVLPEPTLHTVIRTAAAEDSDLWPHALALRDDEATLGSMVRGVIRHALWDVALPLRTLMPASDRRRLVNLPALHDDAVLGELLAAARDHDLWHALLPLVSVMDTPLRERTGRLLDTLDEDTLHHLLIVTETHALWSPALILVLHMSDTRRGDIARLMAAASDTSVERLLTDINEREEWLALMLLFGLLDEDMRRLWLQRLLTLPA
ncbi:hypothetical protein [Perlucidibaca piscinae]|uniref:hypothetical protein n=1 Tax=Perlucidibaca piscinae TaxID=392589 RepID=UPI0003B5DD7E|nr:hypothetical protein [Perlucidibaca piscinae]